jgi:hypothetical protein
LFEHFNVLPWSLPLCLAYHQNQLITPHYRQAAQYAVARSGGCNRGKTSDLQNSFFVKELKVAGD